MFKAISMERSDNLSIENISRRCGKVLISFFLPRSRAPQIAQLGTWLKEKQCSLHCLMYESKGIDLHTVAVMPGSHCAAMLHCILPQFPSFNTPFKVHLVFH